MLIHTLDITMKHCIKILGVKDVYIMERCERIEFSKVRLERAHEFLDAAVINLENAHYLTAANRAYYAAYSAIRALLILEHNEMVKHSGNLSEFRRHYIKTGLFKKEFSEYIRTLFVIRNDSDYDPMYIISKDEIAVQVEHAKDMVNEITSYLASVFDKDKKEI